MAIVKRTIEGMYELLTYTSAFKPHVYLAYLKKKKKVTPAPLKSQLLGSCSEALSKKPSASWPESCRHRSGCPLYLFTGTEQGGLLVGW